jgi:hypothetical protein
MPYICPVCGFPELQESPRSNSGGGSYEICPSCGFEFGVTDDDEGFTYRAWREKWVNQGMRWWAQSIRDAPTNWNPVEQLKNIADEES